MIQLSTLPTTGVMDAPRGPGLPLVVGGDFALALAALVLPKAGAPATAPLSQPGEGPPLAGDRQALAVGGTILPAAEEIAAPEPDIAAKILRKPPRAVRPCDITLLPDLPMPPLPSPDMPVAPVDRITPADVDSPKPAPDAAIPIVPVPLPLPIATPAPAPPSAKARADRAPIGPPTPDLAAPVDALVSAPPVSLSPARPSVTPQNTAAAAPGVTPVVAAVIRQSLATADTPRARVVPENAAVVDPSSPRLAPRFSNRSAPAAAPMRQSPATVEVPRVSVPPDAEPPPSQYVPSVAARPAPTSPAVVSTPIAPTAPTPVQAVAQVGTAATVSAAPAPAPRPRPLQSPPRPIPAPAAPSPTLLRQSAGQMFAAAMFAAEQPGGAAERDALATDLAATISLAGAGAVSNPPTLAVPAAHAREPLLDLARGDWMGSMIDRIETLRDAGGARETRLRLSPDALGSVDIAISHDDTGAIQIRIAADTVQARAILADAAPRLADMAEARGLKLGGGGFDADAAGHQGRDAHAPSALVPMRPASAVAESDDSSTDTRIA